MTKEKERNFQMTNKWHICNILYAEKSNRVRAHCQVTGKYRGSFHQICNPNWLSQKITVIFNNVIGYDNHQKMVRFEKK